MTTKPIRSYRDRILRVYDYIKQNLSGDLSVDRLSDVACLSSYHFHRVYRRLVGETLNGAAQRCRLYHAGKLLAETSTSLAEVAYLTGYNRVDSFSRAFHRFYRVSPVHYRQYHEQQLSLVTMATSLSSIDYGFRRHDYSTSSDKLSLDHDSSWRNLYEVKLVTLPRAELICLESNSTTEVLEPKFVDLNLHAQNYQLGMPTSNFMGIFFKDLHLSDVVKFNHRYALAALPISTPQREELERFGDLPFKLQFIQPGLYATYIYTGPYSLSERSHQWLIGYWARANGLRVCGAPIIEEYLNDPRTVQPSLLKTRVFVQVEHC